MASEHKSFEMSSSLAFPRHGIAFNSLPTTPILNVAIAENHLNKDTQRRNLNDTGRQALLLATKFSSLEFLSQCLFNFIRHTSNSSTSSYIA
jgi:hypothetical protein